MLFDLQGKRRRLIQGTYLLLAILMAGGLVLFGIGSDVQGGLADIFSGSGSTTEQDTAEDNLEAAQERLDENPDDPDALAQLVVANYQLALAPQEEDPTVVPSLFAEDAQPRLEAAADAWQRYLELDAEDPDEVAALRITEVYGPQGLNQPADAADAQQIVASENPSTQAYASLAALYTLADDQRQADLAARRAVQLAPADQRDQAQRQVDAIIASAEAQAMGAAGGTAPGATGGAPVPPGGAPVPPGGATGGEGGGGQSGGGGGPQGGGSSGGGD
jgi:hypothetical protein